MKYPEQQFKQLTKDVSTLNAVVNVELMNVHNLHYVIAQQYNEGQKHNWIYTKGGEIKKAHNLESLTGWEKLIKSNFDFKLYPDGCNDNHIETAVKRVIKNL